MNEKDAECFLNNPIPIIIPNGKKLFRVISSTKPINNGPWWLFDPFPQTRTAWRADYAVLTKWNSDDEYIEWDLEDDIPAWIAPDLHRKLFGLINKP